MGPLSGLRRPFLLVHHHRLSPCGQTFFSFLHSVLLQAQHLFLSRWLHLWRQPTFPTDGVNDFWSLHTTRFIYRRSLHLFSDMLRIPCLFLFCVLWGLVHGGPLTNPHPSITDQDLFWGADQYDFSVVLRASGMECFWHFAHRGERFYLSFMVRTAAASTRFPQHEQITLKVMCCNN